MVEALAAPTADQLASTNRSQGASENPPDLSRPRVPKRPVSGHVCNGLKIRLEETRPFQVFHGPGRTRTSDRRIMSFGQAGRLGPRRVGFVPVSSAQFARISAVRDTFGTRFPRATTPLGMAGLALSLSRERDTLATPTSPCACESGVEPCFAEGKIRAWRCRYLP
jgi:hypothetical protein